MNKKYIFLKIIKASSWSALLFLCIFLLTKNSGNVNHAKLLYQNISQYEKTIPYTFKVGEKLAGTGDMILTIDGKKIKGTALGLGRTCQCNVDFHTNIEGTIDTSCGKVNVTVIGIGDPLGIPIPGKINFHGPLKGFVNHKKLNLIGKVNIKGKLASFAGFKKIEDIVIEISDPSLALKLKEMQRQESLASL